MSMEKKKDIIDLPIGHSLEYYRDLAEWRLEYVQIVRKRESFLSVGHWCAGAFMMAMLGHFWLAGAVFGAAGAVFLVAGYKGE